MIIKKAQKSLRLNYVFENINKEPIENLLPYSKNIIEKLR
jgi:hypothetical protein